MKKWEKSWILYSRSSDYATSQVFTIVGIWHYGSETPLPIMRTALFWGYLLPAAVGRGRRSDLLKVPIYVDPDSEAVREGLLYVSRVMLSNGKTTNECTREGLESRSVVQTLERVEAYLQ